jgi:hypothetical protein
VRRRGNQVHRYVCVVVGRLTLALSPHGRLRDRPTTPMRSGPTAETCLRRTCRFPFFCRYILRPRLPSTNRDSRRGEYGTCLASRPFLISTPRAGRTPGGLELLAPWASSRVSSVITLERAGWFVYRGLGYCGVKSPTCRAREALEEGVAWLVACPVAGYVQLPTTHASTCRVSLHRIYRT